MPLVTANPPAPLCKARPQPGTQSPWPGLVSLLVVLLVALTLLVLATTQREPRAAQASHSEASPGVTATE